MSRPTPTDKLRQASICEKLEARIETLRNAEKTLAEYNDNEELRAEDMSGFLEAAEKYYRARQSLLKMLKEVMS